MLGLLLSAALLGFQAQQPWLARDARRTIGPVCASRLPKAFRGGGQEELWEGAEWDGRIAEITVSESRRATDVRQLPGDGRPAARFLPIRFLLLAIRNLGVS